jgi:ribonuclease Z
MNGRRQANKDRVCGPQVRVVGSGEAFDVGRGNTSYLLSGAGCPTVLFDCGYQVPERLWDKGLHEGIEAICLTHLHADHSFGLVPLLVRYFEDGRSETLHIFGPRGTERFVCKLLELGYPGVLKVLSFPLEFHTLSPSAPMKFGAIKLSVAATVHSVLNYTIRVDLKTAQGERSFAVSGDGQITEQTKALVADVDCLFQEVYSEAPGIPIHADLETLSDWVVGTQIKRVVASHFGRSAHRKLSVKVKGSGKSGIPWSVARPGLIVRF